MRIAVAVLMMAALPIPAIAQLADPLTSGILVPTQMPDGSKLWRFSVKELKGEALEIRYTDLIAQALARSQWCSGGWEETARSTPSKGFVFIEGRCK
jgi:hypothetical protein